MKLAIINPLRVGFSGGYLKHLQQIVPRLARDPRISALSLWSPDGINLPAIDGAETRRWRGGLTRAGLEQLRAGVRGSDVAFVPTARHLDLGAVPVTVMIRNMEPLTVPFGGNDLSECVRNLARRRVARLACARAARVIAVSEHVASFVRDRWRVPAERIGVVYHGVTPPVAAAGERPAALAAIAGQPFLFTAGSLRAARGIEDALDAMPRILRGRPDLRLVVAGQWDPGTTRYRRRIEALVRRHQLHHALVWAGQLTPPQMAWCFDEADAFVITTRAEACPNTALEALSHGCRVVSTSTAPMPEFLGDAALYYPPRDGASLAGRLMSLSAGGDGAALRRRARARAADFRWEVTADATIVELERASERRCVDITS